MVLVALSAQHTVCALAPACLECTSVHCAGGKLGKAMRCVRCRVSATKAEGQRDGLGGKSGLLWSGSLNASMEDFCCVLEANPS